MDQEKNKPGRKKKSDSSRKKAHQVYATDEQWFRIIELANSEGLDVSPYIISKVLS